MTTLLIFWTLTWPFRSKGFNASFFIDNGQMKGWLLLTQFYAMHVGRFLKRFKALLKPIEQDSWALELRRKYLLKRVSFDIVPTCITTSHGNFKTSDAEIRHALNRIFYVLNCLGCNLQVVHPDRGKLDGRVWRSWFWFYRFFLRSHLVQKWHSVTRKSSVSFPLLEWKKVNWNHFIL